MAHCLCAKLFFHIPALNREGGGEEIFSKDITIFLKNKMNYCRT